MSDTGGAKGSISREGGYIVIRIPEAEVHSLRVSLEPCLCRAVKSTETMTIRERLSKGLARAMTKANR